MTTKQFIDSLRAVGHTPTPTASVGTRGDSLIDFQFGTTPSTYLTIPKAYIE